MHRQWVVKIAATVSLIMAAAACAQPVDNLSPNAKQSLVRNLVTVSVAPDAPRALIWKCNTSLDYADACKIYIMDLTTRSMSLFRFRDHGLYQWPSFSADGKYIVAVETTADDLQKNIDRNLIVRFRQDGTDKQVADRETGKILNPLEFEAYKYYFFNSFCSSEKTHFCDHSIVSSADGVASPALNFADVGQVTKSHGIVYVSGTASPTLPNWDYKFGDIFRVSPLTNHVKYVDFPGVNGASNPTANNNGNLYFMGWNSRIGTSIYRMTNKAAIVMTLPNGVLGNGNSGLSVGNFDRTAVYVGMVGHPDEDLKLVTVIDMITRKWSYLKIKFSPEPLLIDVGDGH